MLPVNNLRAISIWRYCAHREREGGRRNEYTFLLWLCFNGRIDGGTVCDKQTDLGREIRFEKSFRRALFMALNSEHWRDIPLRSRRVLSRNQAKSEIYDFPAFPPSPFHPFLFLSGYGKRQNLTKRETISVTRFKPLLNLILWENTRNANHSWKLFYTYTAIEKYIERKNFWKNFHFDIIY